MYKSIDVYQEAYQIAFAKGLIIADTKLEWGQLKHCENEVVLIDEIITPDSSRLWPVESYRVPGHIDSLDKQYIRDYLAVAGKDTAVLPEDVMTTAKNKYVEAYRRLTSDD
jgi:phosphoribosylaminoimidazole-succinocarboxamide synthase